MMTESNVPEVEATDDIAEELAMLMALLESGARTTSAIDVAMVREAQADAAPRITYKLVGPTLTRVAAAGIATLPAVLTPMPAFAGTPMPQSLMVAMAARPKAPPTHGMPPALAATGTQFFPFTRPMQAVRNTVATSSDTLAAAPTLALNPRLRSIFSEQRQVAITTKRQLSASVYKVQKGDSLYSIAAELLGSGGRWREIYDGNQTKIGSGYLLLPGQRLSIATSKPTAPAHATLANKPTTAPVTVAANAKPPSSKPYHVAVGDNLYTIAAKQLGNPTRWKEIVSLNKATLNGRTMIFPNQWLVLPTQV